MEWQDCLLDRDVPGEELAAALAEFLEIAPADILIVDELSEDITENIQLICHRIPARGEFCLLLCPYPRSQAAKDADCTQAVRYLSRKLRCRCLIPDEQLNPYSWLLLDNGEGPQPAFLETEGLDREPEEYRLKREP